MSAFDRIRSLIQEASGIDLERGGQGDALRRSVARRVAALGLTDVDAYAERIDGPKHPEIGWILNAMTVGHTWFYRDPPQMEVIAKLFAEQFHTTGTLALWVPGCATGEDVYTLAMLAAEARRAISILGTDINTAFLEHASRGVYDERVVRDLPEALARHLERTREGRFRVATAIRSSVRFQPHNLIDPPCEPPGAAAGWDVILCRNVIIYFSAATAQATVLKLARSLSPEGRLLLGASELIHSIPPDLRIEEALGRVLLRRELTPTVRGPGHAVPARLPPVPPVPPFVALPTETVARKPPVPAATPPATALPPTLQHGAELLHKGDLDGAVAAYLELLERQPLGVEPRMLLGIAYHLQGRGSQAINALRAALFLDPDLWPAAFYLALTYEQLGQVPQAQREYRRVLDAATRARPLNGSRAHDDLERWKHEMVEVARRRLR